MSAPPLAAVVAMDRARGIGKDGDLPWRLRGDMAHFKRLTTDAPEGRQNAVVMGRKTYDSIPAKFRPLPGRINIVLSRAADYAPEGAVACLSLDDALALAEARGAARVFAIGGSSVYAAALADPRCELLYVTRVDAELPCDAFFPAFEHLYERVEVSEVHEDGGLCYTMETHRRKE